MKRFLLVAVAAIALVGCSASDPINTFARNLSAAQCSDQAGTLANVPMGFLTPAQAAQILAATCNALYGSVAAPATAPGNQPVFPGPTATATVAAPVAK